MPLGLQAGFLLDFLLSLWCTSKAWPVFYRQSYPDLSVPLAALFSITILQDTVSHVALSLALLLPCSDSHPDLHPHPRHL